MKLMNPHIKKELKNNSATVKHTKSGGCCISRLLIGQLLAESNMLSIRPSVFPSGCFLVEAATSRRPELALTALAQTSGLAQQRVLFTLDADGN